MYGFESDRFDCNLANLQATIYNTTEGIKQAKGPKEFLLKFETEQDQSGDELFAHLELFAARHNALVKRK